MVSSTLRLPSFFGNGADAQQIRHSSVETRAYRVENARLLWQLWHIAADYRRRQMSHFRKTI
jgi:hypothetical protein